MVRAFYPLAVGAALLVLAPLSIAQNMPDPYPGCSSDPDWCDPVAANGGHVKTGDEPVRVILYAHFRDLLQRAPMNTQPPDPVHEPDVNRGIVLPTVSVGEPVSCCAFGLNQFVYYNSPGFVEYTEDGNWRVYQQPGLGTDLRLAGDTMTGFFYVSPGEQEAPEAPGVVPAVGARMTMSLGWFPSEDPAMIVASGDTGTAGGSAPTHLLSTATLVSPPGSDPVFELRVPMRIHESEVPSVYDASGYAQGLLVQVTVYQLDADAVSATQNNWRVRTGHQWPPRIVMDVQEPLAAEPPTLRRATDGSAVIEWDIRGTFGSYDVLEESVGLGIDGPSNASAEFITVRVSADHDGYLKPVKAFWRLPENGTLTDGTYTATAFAKNHQGTYRAEAATTFEVVGGTVEVQKRTPIEGDAVLPGPSIGALMGLLLGAAVWLRRRA